MNETVHVIFRVVVAAIAVLSSVATASAVDERQAARWIAVRFVPEQTAVGLAWTAVTGAVGYTILRKEVDGGEFRPVGTVTRLQFLDRGVERRKRYRYVVRAEDATKSGPLSVEIEVLALDPGLVPPAAPVWTDFVADQREGVSLFWAATARAAGYNVYRREGETGAFTLLGSARSSPYSDKGVQAGGQFEYRISAVNAGGIEGPFSETRTARVAKTVAVDSGKAEAITIRVRPTRPVPITVRGGQIPFKAPVDIAMDRSGKVYVLDNQVPAVFVFSPEGELLRTLGRPDPQGAPVLRSPYGIGVDESGVVWVTDRKKESEIIRLDPVSGNVLEVITFTAAPRPEALERLPPRRRGERPFAYDVGFLPGGEIVVTDNTFNRVCRLDRKGKLLAEFGLPGDGPGELDHPSKIGVDPEGRIVVLDAQNRRVQVFDREGTFLHEIGRSATMVGGFLGLSGIAFDAEGSVFIADSPMATVQAFSREDGSYRYHVGGEDARSDAGGNRSLWDVVTPSGLAFDPATHRLWIGMPMIANVAIREFLP